MSTPTPAAQAAAEEIMKEFGIEGILCQSTIVRIIDRHMSGKFRSRNIRYFTDGCGGRWELDGGETVGFTKSFASPKTRKYHRLFKSQRNRRVRQAAGRG